MTAPYEEILEGESHFRLPPSLRHEEICDRLHTRIQASLSSARVARLLPCRTRLELRSNTLIRPDLALVTAATGKLFLVAEIISSDDHKIDTVHKKQLYEEAHLARLWMVDTRYDNVEIYHGGPHGLVLQKILAQREVLREALLPNFHISIGELFSSKAAA